MKNIFIAPIAIFFLSSCSEFSSEGNKFMEIRNDAANFLNCNNGDHQIVINTIDKTSEISLDDSGVFLKGTYKYEKPGKYSTSASLTYFISYFIEDQEVLKYQISKVGGRSIFVFPEIKNIPDIKDKDGKNITLNGEGIVNTQFYTKCVLTDVIPR